MEKKIIDLKREIVINKSWYDMLVKIVDELGEQIDLEDSCIETHGWLSHLLGYVHSLDEHFKEK